MQSETKTVGSKNVTITFPDDVVFVFNPLYIELKVNSGNIDKVEVTVARSSTLYGYIVNSITASVFNSKARIYISRIMQLAFDGIPTRRSESVSVEITSGTDNLFTHVFNAVWGCIGLGQRMNAYGVFAYDSKEPYCYRVRKWFKNFPFKLSVFSTLTNEGIDLYGRTDGGAYSASPLISFDIEGMNDIIPSSYYPNAKYSATFKLPGVAKSKGSSVFDDSFDYTFFSSSAYAVITKLEVSNETQGHYLRWIDNFGQLQYYLFVDGKDTIKNKLGSDSIIDTEARGGMWFPDLTRKTSIETTVTRKCCAVSMPQEIWDYVETVIRSPYIDLYLGKTNDGEEIWCPVNIVAASHTYDPTEVLHDLEISFTMPTENTQTL